MNIEIAKQHQKKIMELREELNAAVAHATLDGVFVELELLEVTTIGARYYPAISAKVYVDPTELEAD